MPPRLLRPLPLLALAWLAGLAPLVVYGKDAGVFSAVALAVLGVAQPVSVLFMPHWWAHTAASVAGWIALAAVLGAMPAVAAMREGAMVYMLPFLSYPGALALTAAIRCVMWIVGRRNC